MLKNNLMGIAGKVDSQVFRTSHGDVIDSIIYNSHPDHVKGIGNMWLRRYKEINWANICRGLDKIILAHKAGIPTFYGLLYAKLIKSDGDVLDYGIVSTRVITTVGAGFIVDAFQNIVEVENMKFHGIGTNAAAEAAGDTALGAELTTQLNPDNTRATGTTTEGASGNIYRTVGTNVVDAGVTITEHGIFSSATVAAGVLLDRSVFGGIAMVSTDSLQTTYELTVATGG